jgi:hypothetical protein
MATLIDLAIVKMGSPEDSVMTNFEQKPLIVPENTPDCAKPVQPPGPLLEEFLRLKTDPSTKVVNESSDTHFIGKDGTKMAGHIDGGTIVIKDEITGQTDQYILNQRMSTHFSVKEPGGISAQIHALWAGGATFSLESGVRQDQSGNFVSSYWDAFNSDGEARYLQCRDKDGTTIFDAELPMLEDPQP